MQQADQVLDASSRQASRTSSGFGEEPDGRWNGGRRPGVAAGRPPAAPAARPVLPPTGPAGRCRAAWTRRRAGRPRRRGSTAARACHRVAGPGRSHRAPVPGRTSGTPDRPLPRRPRGSGNVLRFPHRPAPGVTARKFGEHPGSGSTATTSSPRCRQMRRSACRFRRPGPAPCRPGRGNRRRRAPLPGSRVAAGRTRRPCSVKTESPGYRRLASAGAPRVAAATIALRCPRTCRSVGPGSPRPVGLSAVTNRRSLP